MFNRDKLSKIADIHEPADIAQIKAAEKALGLVFPNEYIELMCCSDGLESTINANRYAIGLFHIHELYEYAESYQIKEYFPGYLFIGFDGGGRGIFLRCSMNQSPVFLCATSSAISDMREVAPSLSAWITNQFDLGDPPETDHPERVDIYALKQPNGGVKGLLKICKHLQLTVPVSELRGILRNIPCCLCHNVPFLPYVRYVKEINNEDPCMGVFEVDKPDCPISIHPWEWQMP